MITAMRCVLALMLVACGSRTDLSSLPKPPQEDAAPSQEPCFEVSYVEDASAVVPFALTATHVYYVRIESFRNELVRVPKEGGDAEVVHTFVDGPDGPVQVDATSLYWHEKEAVLTASNTGSAATSLADVKGLGGVITQNDASVLVLLDPGSFGSLAKTGGDVVPIAPPNAPTGPVLDAYADNARVYWITTEHVYALGLAPPFELTSYGGWPTGLAIDASSVYWATTTKDETDVVHVANKDDASKSVVLEGHAHGPIAVGQKVVFGVGQGGIVRVPIASGAATLVEPVLPNRIATDASCVYYSAPNGKKNGQPIQKIARFPQ